MTQTISDFLRELADGRQLSPHTIAAYKHDLSEFTAFLETYFQTDNWEWSQVDRNALRRFLGYMAQQKLARRTIARRLSAVRTLFRFLHREDLVEANPARAVRSPKLEKSLPQWLTRSDAERVFSVAENRASEGGLKATRDLAILETFYATGIRLSELQGLDMDDVDLIGEQVKVRGKGRKERIVPLGSSAVKALRKYELRRAEVAARGPAAEKRRRRKRYQRQRHDRINEPGNRAPGGCRRRPGGRHVAARAAALLCHPPAGRRRRSHGRQRTAGSRFLVDDQHLHAHFKGATQEGLRPGPSARVKYGCAAVPHPALALVPALALARFSHYILPL